MLFRDSEGVTFPVGAKGECVYGDPGVCLLARRSLLTSCESPFESDISEFDKCLLGLPDPVRSSA